MSKQKGNFEYKPSSEKSHGSEVIFKENKEGKFTVFIPNFIQWFFIRRLRKKISSELAYKYYSDTKWTKLKRWLGNLTRTFIVLDVHTLPDFMDGDKKLNINDWAKIYKETKIIIYDSSTGGHKPMVFGNVLFPWFKVKIVDSKDLTKEQLDKLSIKNIKKMNFSRYSGVRILKGPTPGESHLEIEIKGVKYPVIQGIILPIDFTVMDKYVLEEGIKRGHLELVK